MKCYDVGLTIIFLVRSAVALIKELLVEDVVEYVLTEKFNQEQLEQYFGKQLMRGDDNTLMSRSMGIMQ